jgi:hypothetical protein
MNEAVNKTKYPLVGIRLSKSLDKRLREVARISGRKLSEVIRLCAQKELPAMEKELGIQVE